MARNARYGTCKRVIREAQSKQKWKQIGFATPNEPAICYLFFLELFAHMWRRIFFVWRKFEQSKHTPLVLLVRMQDNTTLHNAFSGMTADAFEAIAICNFLCSNPTTDFGECNKNLRAICLLSLIWSLKSPKYTTPNADRLVNRRHRFLQKGCSGNWTRELSHPKRESCH